MANLSVGSLLSYLTNVDGVQWGNVDYIKRNIVRALKGEDFNGYCALKIGGQNREFYSKDKDDLARIALRQLAKCILGRIEGNFTIVPVPNSHMAINSAAQGRIVWCAEQLDGFLPQSTGVEVALLWAAPKEKAHLQSGVRSPELHQENLIIANIPKGRIVLFDDVVTSGAQIIACTRVLRDAGNIPIYGATMARASKDQTSKLLEWEEQQFEIDPVPFDWDF